MKLFAYLEKLKDFWFLLFTSCIFFLLRLPSLFEPYWYGDEGIYQTMATAMNNGSLLYRDIWDNKPPLLYILYALFNGDQFSLRLVSLLFGLLSVIVFFFMSRKIFTNRASTYTATALFALLFALPIFEGNIANAENFMLLPILTAGFLILRYLNKPSKKGLWYAGIFLSLAFLIKIVAIFDFVAFGLFLLITQYQHTENVMKEIRKFLPLLYGFFFPILTTILFFAANNTLGAYISAAFAQNIGYVGYGNAFLIPQGLLYVKIILLLVLIGFLFFHRKKIPAGALLVYLWLSFSLFNAFFSQRPYTHYILVLLPSVCLFIGLVLSPLSARIVHIGRRAFPLRLIHGVLLLLVVFLIWKNFDIYKKNLSYYQNFLAFVNGKKDLSSYQTFFDSDMPRAYEVAQFLKMHTKKNTIVFIWGNPAQVYKMSETLPPGRYTVAYHITGSKESMEETAKAITVKKPKFIVLISSRNYPFNLSSYRYVYSVQGAAIYEYLF